MCTNTKSFVFTSPRRYLRTFERCVKHGISYDTRMYIIYKHLWIRQSFYRIYSPRVHLIKTDEKSIQVPSPWSRNYATNNIYVGIKLSPLTSPYDGARRRHRRVSKTERICIQNAFWMCTARVSSRFAPSTCLCGRSRLYRVLCTGIRLCHTVYIIRRVNAMNKKYEKYNRPRE